MKSFCEVESFCKAAIKYVENTTCGCHEHPHGGDDGVGDLENTCPSSMLVESRHGGKPVSWPSFLKAYNSSDFRVHFDRMHSDHFTAVFTQASNSLEILRICVLAKQKEEIEAWAKHH